MNTEPDRLNQLEYYTRRVLTLTETDPQLKAMMPKEAVQRAVRKPGMSYSDIVATVLDGYAERPALATREYRIAPDPSTGNQSRQYLPRYTTISYRELRGRVEALASALRHHEHHRLAMDDFVCIFGFNGIDFATVELACVYLQATTVPLQSSLAGTELGRIVHDTAAPVLVATVDDLALVAELALANPAVRSIIAIDYDERDDDDRAKLEAARNVLAGRGGAIKLITLTHLIDFGRAHTWKPLPPHALGAERMASIMHSSGSTGTPKGAIIPERMSTPVWIGSYMQQLPCVGMVFAPMNHFMGRYVVFQTLAQGGTAYYTLESDLSTLFEDIRLVRPTFISFFPRIFDLIYQYYQTEVIRRTGAEEGNADAVGQKVRAEMHDKFLGDRLRGATIGSAPTSPEVKQFIRECFDIMLLEGYGSTEGGIQITSGDRVLRPPVIDYKLRDVPELGYYTTDKPYPRGELCVKSTMQVPGYFKRPEATAALFDENGYVLTGDIMEERAPDHIVYIDRRNDVLKLSQAEFVAVGPLGTTFESGSAAIKQIYVYGNSSRSYLLAVVVPDMEVVASLIGPKPEETKLKALIRSEMQRVATDAGLRSFEVPRDFIIEMDPFSHENGLLSSVQKRMRPNFKRKYGDRLEELYAQIERKRYEELMALKDPKSPMTVLEKVGKALEASLGIEGIELSTPLGFRELGGDSIGAVSYALFLEDIFGVQLPVNAILSPAGNPHKWAKAIEAALNKETRSMPTFASVHGNDARILRARDLDIVKFLDEQTLAHVPTAEPPMESRVVLLTGANGFLGHILCLEWMQKLARNGGKVICLIRGPNNAAARARLDEVFAGVDAELENHYRALAAKHLEVLAGDISEPCFGLSESEWARLADEVDRIVHPAALVNHRLPYEHLFAPNVFGTAELIRLALTRRQKRFDNVSSAAVTLLVDESLGNNEDSPLLESVALSDEYAAGYGASKWAAEWLLQTANRRFGLPVNTFRGDMILPHTRYKGQINVPDMITRLLYSVITTGLAPESFYEREPDGSRARAHYDGLPVDFIAEAMVGIGSRPHRQLRTFNVQNDHDDGVSLDSFVDWVESAGYPIERVGDHKQWLQRFEAKLSTLSEPQRQHSSINILGYFRRPHPAHPPAYGCEHFKAAVRLLPIGPEVPHLTEAYVHKYLDDMRRLGLLGDAKPKAHQQRANQAA
jgi:fatty acid CoA ligase FadD9